MILRKEAKKGQVTIFIIIAILVVAAGILLYYFYPKFGSGISKTSENPNSFIGYCIQEELENVIEKISLQGGSYEPGFSYNYQGNEVEYLCYTNEYYEPCINQNPFIKEHIEEEILEAISGTVEGCFNSLERSYIDKGYKVNLEKGISKIKILPEEILLDLDSKLTLTKNEANNYENFVVITSSNLYELFFIVNNIVTWDINFGDSNTDYYMETDPYIKVEKRRKSDDTKIYIITDRNTEEVFQFAIRSFALPPGY